MRLVIGVVGLALATPAAAEVVAVAPDSFVVEHSTTIEAAQGVVWDTLRSPARWWNPDHSYSGDSANLYMDSQATGCFCERVPKDGGSVEHGHIVYVARGRMIRMQSALGPLQAEAVTGTLTFKVDPQEDKTVKFTLTYLVGGYMRQGGEAMAPLVDRVLGDQVARLKKAAKGPQPAAPPGR